MVSKESYENFYRSHTFHTTYGAEALIPVEVGQTSLKVRGHEPSQNERTEALDFFPELREEVAMRVELYDARITSTYKRRVSH